MWPAIRNCLLVGAGALLLWACSSPDPKDGPPDRPMTPTRQAHTVECRAGPRGRAGNPPSYVVFGKRYFTMKSSDDYSARGVASWYGTKFHGERTSSGETYDMYAMTAAHKTLPIPACVEVTNLRNGRRIVVKVNDRGPFVDNRLIDLSYAAAMELDMVRDGTALVEVRSLSQTDHPAPARIPQRTSESALYIQAGAFSDAGNARRLADRLRQEGFQRVLIQDAASHSGPTIYRVRLGPIGDVEGFDNIIARLAAIDIHDAHLAPQD